MRNILLLATGGLILATLVKNMKSFADNLRVYVGIAGLPKLKGLDMHLPVRVRIDNPERQSFQVTELFLTVFKKQPAGSPPAYLASTQPLPSPLTIKAADTTEFSLDVRIATQDALMEAYSAFTAGNTFSVDNYLMQGYLKADGIRIPIDTTTQNQPTK